MAKRKLVVQVDIEIDYETWVENNNGPWPEGPGRALNAAVRHDIRSYIQTLLDGSHILAEECEAKVVVR